MRTRKGRVCLAHRSSNRNKVRKSRRCTGLTRVELVVSVCATLFLVGVVLVPALGRLRQLAFRASCGHRLSTIGRAMFAYASDNEGALPRAGGPGAGWGRPIIWDAPDHAQAFQTCEDGSGGHGTISSSLYLLVKYYGVPPESFVCRNDAGTIPFKLSSVPEVPEGFGLSDAWDFGPQAYRHCSNAYHFPYGRFPLTTSRDPGMAVAADRNPWIKSQAADGKDLLGFEPDIAPYNASPELGCGGNAISHRSEGQNVLFLDGHVAFEKRSFCGVNNDNIYLVSDYADAASPRGRRPTPEMAAPSNEKDSVLVHDPRDLGPAPYRATKTHHVDHIESKQLNRTTVLPTLDCPLPQRKNAIWCATFQMAWDILRDDIVREPVRVLGAQGLADRLNGRPFPVEDIEEESYYVAAGAVADGLLEEIQETMAGRFPSEEPPTFDTRYRRLPDVVAAYAYLNAAVDFEHPFYTNNRAFAFRDADGERTDVTSFCSYATTKDVNVKHVRGQVEILAYRYGENRNDAEFVVDLCRNTQPYQVMAARVPWCGTLGQAADDVAQAITEFKDDPDREVLRNLRPIDKLIVPDVLFKLTHHFAELEGKSLGNVRWDGYFIFDAQQTIDFALSRTGVILKSRAVISAASAAPPRRNIQEPRYLYFDRPFLIVVKKRRANAAPFFVMWVDNAELLREY